MTRQPRSARLSRRNSTRRIRLFESLEPRALLAASVSISDATAIEGSDTLKSIDQFIAAGSGGVAHPRGLTFGPDGNGDGAADFYVASADTHQVLRYDGVTGAFLDVFVASGSGGLKHPGLITFGPDGDLYVISLPGSTMDAVLRFDGDTGTFVGTVMTGLSSPLDIQFGPDGALYVANRLNHEVLRRDQFGQTTFVSAGTAGLNEALGITFGPDGNEDGKDDLYVVSRNTREVLRFDGTTGAYIDTFASTDPANPALIRFAADGYAYVTRRTGVGFQTTIDRFDAATGAFVDTLPLLRDGWSFTLDSAGLIYNSSLGEGHFIERFGHTSLAAFTVTLSEPSASPVTVTYATSNGSATAGSDYIQTSSTLTFAPGQTRRTILVQTLSDSAIEPSETFSLNLSNASGATIADAQATGTIQDGANSGPSILISDATVTEGDTSIRFIDRFVPSGSGGLSTPRAVTVGPDGNLYVGHLNDQNGAAVLRFNGQTGEFMGVFADGSSTSTQTSQVVFHNDFMFVATGNTGILRFNAATGAPMPATGKPGAQFATPINEGVTDGAHGLAFGPDGHLYITSNVTNQVLKYDGTTGQFLGVFVAAGSGGLAGANALTFGADGTLYVASSGDSSVGRYQGPQQANPGAFLDTFVSSGTGGLDSIPAGGLRFGPDGDLYVASRNNSRVLRFNGTTGALVQSVISGEGGLSTSGGLTFDGDGRLYVVSQTTSSVLRYAQSSQAVFKVSLNEPAFVPVTLTYQTANLTANAGSDYTSTQGTITFAPGETEKSILIATRDDNVAELSETFTVILSNASGATIADFQGLGTIQDDDLAGPSISISDSTVVEGDPSPRYFDTFISAPNSGGLTNANQATFGPDGSLYVASGDTDSVLRYDGKTGDFLGAVVPAGAHGLDYPWGLTFGPDNKLYVAGRRSDNILRYDPVTQQVETYVADGNGLRGPAGMTFGSDGQLYVANSGRGVGRPDGPGQVLRFAGPAGGPNAEQPGTPLGVFVSTGSGASLLSSPDHLAFNGGYLYVANAAIASVNRYDAETGAFVDVFIPSRSQGLDVPVYLYFHTDGLLYVASQVSGPVLRGEVRRYNSTTGAFVDIFARATIPGRPNGIAVDADGVFHLSYGAGASEVQRHGPGSIAAFTVSLNEPSAAPVTVSFATSNGSAIVGNDLAATTGSVIFAPGQTTRTILVRTIDDSVAEGSETFSVNLSNAVGATIADGKGIGTIQDNDPATPVVSISTSVLVQEGLTAEVPFTVTRGGPIDSPVTVNYATSDGTAFAGINYAATSGTLTFAAGETEKTILVPIFNDGTTDFVDSFTVTLSNATGATIGAAQAVGNIVDNDSTDWKWTVRASDDQQRVEVYFGNPVAPDAEVVFTAPLISFVPLDFTTDDLADDNDQIFIELPAGTDGPARGIRLDTERGHNELIVKSGRVRIDSVSTGGTLDTIVHAGAELITEQFNQNELTVAAQGRVTLLSAGLTSKLTGLAVAKGGMLDLAENALVVDYDGDSPLAAIREQVLTGRGGPGFGASWKGPGINSSAVAEANQFEPEAYSIAFAENSALPLGPYADFHGVLVDDTSILIAYTRTGDANLDGVVNDDDVTIVNATYAPGAPQPHWALGDFDFSGFVDDDDITLLSAFYDPASTPLAPPHHVVWAVPTESTALAAAKDLLFSSSDQFSDSAKERQGLDAALAGAKDYGGAVAYLLAEREDPFRPKSLALRSFSH